MRQAYGTIKSCYEISELSREIIQYPRMILLLAHYNTICSKLELRYGMTREMNQKCASIN